MIEFFIYWNTGFQTLPVTKSPSELVVLGGRSPLCEGLRPSVQSVPIYMDNIAENG